MARLRGVNSDEISCLVDPLSFDSPWDVTMARTPPATTEPLLLGRRPSTTGGLRMADGVAGVLWALRKAGHEVVPAHLDRLVEAVRLAENAPPGLYDGLCGIAVVLDQCGRREDALDTLALALDQLLDPEDLSLFSGTAGIGLALLYFEAVTHEPRYLELAIDVATRSASEFAKPDRRPVGPGLMRGWSGFALFLIRLHERTADRELLDVASDAIAADLDHSAGAA